MKCLQATRTLSESQERTLALGEQVSLRVHLALCSSCRNFERQVHFLRDAVRGGYARQPDERDSSQ